MTCHNLVKFKKYFCKNSHVMGHHGVNIYVHCT